MKNLFRLFSIACLCVLLASCEDDNKMTLTVNTSAYNVFRDLKQIDGTNHFIDRLPDELEVRFCYLVVRQRENLSENDEIVEMGEAYTDNINSVVSYTTGELFPGIYNVYVTTDLVKGPKEYNSVLINEQYKSLDVRCAIPSGAYNAFGTAFCKDLLVEEKTEIDLDTRRRGSLVTLHFKNTPQTTKYRMQTELFEYYTLDERFSANTKPGEHTNDASATAAQHYCGSASDFYISWVDGHKDVVLTDGRDRVFELNYSTLKITEK